VLNGGGKRPIPQGMPIPRLLIAALLTAALCAGLIATPAGAAQPPSPKAKAAKRCRDIDRDGRPNRRDRDVDGDGKRNSRDRDVDGDRKPNGRDLDVDGDCVPNARDADIDGDGVKNGKDRDADGDGKSNGSDPDIDGDGIPNAEDDNPGAVARYGVGVGEPAEIGLSDSDAENFKDPLLLSLGLRHSRLITPWNSVWKDPQGLDKWLTNARNAGTEVLVSFAHDAGDKCPGDPCSAPGVDEFAAAFREFRARYPWVTTISPWNEVNHLSQPTAHRPELAAQYHNVVAAECPGCRVVAADLIDGKGWLDWLKIFKRHAVGSPQLWGFHNYSDANRFTTDGTDTALKVLPGEIWLTETGGITRFTTPGGVESFPYDEERAAGAMRFLLDRLVHLNSKRITRVYIYHWKQHAHEIRWDSGLLRRDGTTRPVFDVLLRALGR
jgi:hypothetical protein